MSKTFTNKSLTEKPTFSNVYEKTYYLKDLYGTISEAEPSRKGEAEQARQEGNNQMQESRLESPPMGGAVYG